MYSFVSHESWWTILTQKSREAPRRKSCLHRVMVSWHTVHHGERAEGLFILQWLGTETKEGLVPQYSSPRHVPYDLTFFHWTPPPKYPTTPTTTGQRTNLEHESFWTLFFLFVCLLVLCFAFGFLCNKLVGCLTGSSVLQMICFLVYLSVISLLIE